MRWNYTGAPPEGGYVYKIAPNDATKPVGDSQDDDASSHLLLWVYNHFVHWMPDMNVVAHEELLFLVQEASLQAEPEWSATVHCFSVLEQKSLTFTFKLASRN